MVFDRSEHEPEEYDPEANFEDPESDSITIPQVTPPNDPTPDVAETLVPSGEDAPRELAKAFWTIVLVLNAAILAVSVGAMISFFWGDLTRGGALIVGGMALFALAYRRYRAFEAADTESTSTAETVSPENANTPTSEADSET